MSATFAAMSTNVGRRLAASGNMITAGHGTSPPGEATTAGHVPSRVVTVTSSRCIGPPGMSRRASALPKCSTDRDVLQWSALLTSVRCQITMAS